MKCIINGNVATVSTDIKFSDAKKASAKGFIKILGEKDKVLYRATVGKTPRCDEDGVVFTYANKAGKACFNIGPEECGLNENGSLTPEVIADKFGAGLQALKTYEEQVSAAVTKANADREALIGLVTVG